MAKAVINLQKESGGIVKISPVDGIGITEVTVPESGELATKEYTDGLNTSNVKLIGNQTIAGVKTFSSTISGSISGNAASATKLETARTIGGVSFDGTANINLPGVNTAGNQNTTGNAGTVTNGVYTTGNQTIAGVKTFSSSPIVPTPTTATQAVNKDYVDSKPTLSIGTILNGYTIFDNCIVAFGGEFNRADYPKLWAYLQANPSLVKTQAEWTTENTTNGMCGYYSSGNGTTTFRVPNLDKAFLRPDSRSIGTYQEDDFKSHNHVVNGYIGGFFQYSGGGGNSGIGIPSQAQSSTAILNAGGTETRPKNIAVLPLIVAK